MPHATPPRTTPARALSRGQGTADPCFQRRHSNTQRQVWLSLLWGSLFVSLGPSAHKVLFVSLERLWKVLGLILNVTAPLLLSCCGFSFIPGRGLLFLGGSQHCLSMIVQHLIEISVLSAEKMSKDPSTPPS